MHKRYLESKIQTELMVNNLDNALESLGTAQSLAFLKTLNYLKYRPEGMSKATWAEAKGKIRSLAKDYLESECVENA